MKTPQRLRRKAYADRRADEARRAGIHPYFRVTESRQDPVVVMEGRPRIMLGSNNYLGLASDPEVIEASVRAAERYGTGCSGSRFVNGTLDLHLELERELAEFLGKEDALVFGTGFQTNLGAIGTLVGRDDYLLCDAEDHASIFCAARLARGKTLRFRHNDMAGLAARLDALPKCGGALIVVDGVFSMNGDLANLPEICRIASEHDAAVMVDDAHGLGVVGPGGRGTAAHFGLSDEVDLLMGTFSKSLASLGGYVAGERAVIDHLRHASYPFIFSAAIPPANAAAALAALRILRRDPSRVERLAAVSRHAREAFAVRGLIESVAGIVPTPIVPIPTGGTERTLHAVKRIFDAGVFVNPFIPPAVPEGCAVLRTSVMATHTESQIDEAADIIARELRC